MQNLKEFLREHRREILIGAGITAGVVVGGVLVYRVVSIPGTKTIAGAARVADDVAATQVLRNIDVSQHIRNLPSGWGPSAGKVQEAAELGIRLGESQTIVDGFTRTIAA